MNTLVSPSNCSPSPTPLACRHFLSYACCFPFLPCKGHFLENLESRRLWVHSFHKDMHFLYAWHCPRPPGGNKGASGTTPVLERLVVLLGALPKQCQVASVSHRNKAHGFAMGVGSFHILWTGILNITNTNNSFSKLLSNIL